MSTPESELELRTAQTGKPSLHRELDQGSHARLPDACITRVHSVI